MRVRLAVLSAFAAATALGAPHHGEVVRVERRHGPAGTPRLCYLQDASQPQNITAMCLGPLPAAGDRLLMADVHHLVATIKITQAKAGIPSMACAGDSSVSTVTGTLENGDLAAAQGALWGAIDVPIDLHNGHLVTVDRPPVDLPYGVNQIVAYDGDGDGVVDQEFVSFSCDELGNAVQGGMSMCFDAWARRGRGLERIRQDRFRICY